MNKMISPFHLAIPVQNLKEARVFYGTLLDCAEGRSSDKWVDFNFFGHQLVIHEVDSAGEKKEGSNPVDGHEVPVPHFGVILDWAVWHVLREQVEGKVTFVIAPYTRFEGQPGEQATMFFHDPSGNALEFKSFKDMNQLFAK